MGRPWVVIADIGSFEGQLAAFGHRIAGVDRKVEHGELDPGRVGHGGPEIGGEMGRGTDGPAKRAVEKVGHAREHAVEIGRAPIQLLLAREGEELVGEPGPALRGLHGVVQEAQDALVRDLARRELDRPHHGRQQVVEIVRDAAGELADRLHFPALRELLLGLATQLRQFEIGLDPREQLARRERLDEVVVGPGLETLDARLRPCPGREHDDRNRLQGRVPPDLTRERDPIEKRHHYVGEQKVRGTFLERLKGRHTVGHRDDIVGVPEQTFDIGPHVGIVVGEDDARTT